MKCIVLAGGSGDRLWPLSRKNYSKQFMSIRKGRSLFQETLLRNIPFCDEFIILTNLRYENIVKGQLQDFQDLKYSIIMEDAPLKTAGAVITMALNCDKEETFLVVSTDNLIDGDYSTYITKVKEIIKLDKIAIIVASPKGAAYGNHYVEKTGNKIKFTSNWNKNCFLDCGIVGCKVSVLLDNIDKEFLRSCKTIALKDNCFIENEKHPIEHTSLVNVLKTENTELINAKFSCVRITDILSYYDSVGKDYKESNSLEYECKGVKIINTVGDKLVFAQNLKDVVIANTRDAVYITKSNGRNGIKDVEESYIEGFENYFDEYPVSYYDWGVSETIDQSIDYKVSKITVYPKNTLTDRADKNFFTDFLVLDGNIEAKTGVKESFTVKANENLKINGGSAYSITNASKNNITLIKTENAKRFGVLKTVNTGCFVKLKPSFKDYIWGGTRIKDYFGKEVGRRKRVAESWELSAHPAGQSKIANGEFKGLTFTDFIERIGKENLGWKASDYDRFPLMIKFIDAKESLSVQVHPDDEYAFSKEGDYGKNEMWHIIEADKDAFIYLGFNKDVTKEEIAERVKKGTITEILNKIPVKKDETYFLHAGTVHAIGAGCFICEVQQSSNITYRFYDYGRKDDKGKARPIHLKEALEVVDTNKTVVNGGKSEYGAIKFKGYTKQLLGQCKYFIVYKYVVNGELTLAPTGASFRAVVVLKGKGKIDNGNIAHNTSMGDTWFFGCQEIINVKGEMTLVVANI